MLFLTCFFNQSQTCSNHIDCNTIDSVFSLNINISVTLITDNSVLCGLLV